MRIKLLIGFFFIFTAWLVVYRSRSVFHINAWMRENVFNDNLVLFSGRRVAFLLLVLGGVALFSGLDDVIHVQVLEPAVAAKILEQARSDSKKGLHLRVVNQCKELVRAEPNNTEAWELLITAWWALGEKDLARQALQSLLQVNPKHSLGKAPLSTILDKRQDAKH